MSMMIMTNPAKRHSPGLIPGDDKDNLTEFIFCFNALLVLDLEFGLTECNSLAFIPRNVPYTPSSGKRQ